MNSALKPHLLVEVMGLQREPLSPERLCTLFLAYRGFPDAFAFAFRYRCDVRHKVCGPEPKNLTIVTKSGITFKFNEDFHNPILLRIAGRLVHKMIWWCPNDPWIEPFFEGVDENRCLEYINVDVGKHFLQRYLFNHDGLPTVEFDSFGILDELGSPKIDRLVVRFGSVDQNYLRCRIASIVCSRFLNGCDTNPLNIRTASLNYDRNYLKHFTALGDINFDVVIRMIKNSMSTLDELVFHGVSIPYPGTKKSLQDTLDRLNSYVDKLWTTMLGHRGSVSAKAVYKRGRNRYTLLEIEQACRLYLIGYEFSRSSRAIECRTRKEAGNKRLTVCATLLSYW